MGDRAVLVTGGTGFVGAVLVGRLVAEGARVHVMARATSDRSALADLELTWHEGDLLDAASVDSAVHALTQAAAAAGVSADVIHCAALISYKSGDGERARRINVEGTRVLLDACQIHGVRRVVHVSSVVAVGHAPDARSCVDEDTPFNGAELLVDYVTTKRAAEDFALAVSGQLDVVVVNPGAIFGPAPSGSNTLLFLKRVAEGGIGPVAPPGSVGVVGVADVVEGILLALRRGVRGRRYLLSESNLTHRELLELASSVMGARPPRVTAPALSWRALAGLAGVWDRLRPLAEITPQSLRMIGAHFRFDASRAREELGWSPRPFEEVLRDTVRTLELRGDLGPLPRSAG